MLSPCGPLAIVSSKIPSVVGLSLSGPLAIVSTIAIASIVGISLGGPLAIVSSIAVWAVIGFSRPLAIVSTVVTTQSVVWRGSGLGLGIGFSDWLSIGGPLAIVTSIAVASIVGFGRGQSAGRQYSKSKLHLVTMVLSD